LWARPFFVRTDHYSLKFLLDQQLSTIHQHLWVGKLFGYDFSVEFNPGKNNTMVDALSQRDDDTGAAHDVSSQVFTSTFWAELFSLASVTPRLSTTFHPQTTGQSEVTNRILGVYLRCLARDHPKS
jgi:hypothetical protein